MDWGLLDSNAGENRFLREETVYAFRVGYFLYMISVTIQCLYKMTQCSDRVLDIWTSWVDAPMSHVHWDSFQCH